MKNKKIWVAIIIFAIVCIGCLIVFVYNKNSKEYNIEKINKFNYYTIIENSKTGVIDTKGNIVINPQYEAVQIPNPTKPVFICITGYNSESNSYISKVLDENQKELFTQYDEVSAIELKEIVTDIPFEKSVLKYKKDNKYGLINFEGKVITKPIYDELQNLTYKEGELLIKKDNKYGIINIKGKTIIDNKYTEIKVDEHFEEENNYKYSGYIVKREENDNEKYGYINYKGSNIVNFDYDTIERIQDIEEKDNIYLIVEKDGKTGVLKNNNTLINNEYNKIEYDSLNKLFIVQKDTKYGVINFEGNTVLSPVYTSIDIEGMFINAQRENEELVFNSNGEKQENLKYKNIFATESDDYKITIDNNNKYGVIDRNGKILIPNKFYYIEYLYKNYFIVSGENGKSGILNSNSEEILSVKFDIIQKLENANLIESYITEDDTIALYNDEIKEIINIKSGKLYEKDNYIKIYSNKELKYFNLEGIEIKNTEIFKNNKLFASQNNGKWGFVDKDGNIKVKYEYEEVTEFNEEGFAGIKKDGKWGSIKEDGTIVKQPTYMIESDSTEPNFIGEYYKVVSGYKKEYYSKDII